LLALVRLRCGEQAGDGSTPGHEEDDHCGQAILQELREAL